MVQTLKILEWSTKSTFWHGSKLELSKMKKWSRVKNSGTEQTVQIMEWSTMQNFWTGQE